MKKLVLLKLSMIVLAVLSMNMSCHECGAPAVTTYYASANVFDQVTGTYTQTFNFTQTQKNYSKGDCNPFSSSTTLKITNITPFTASFVYTIIYNLNLVSWQKQGSITIGPQGTVDVGEISQSGARIDLGEIVVIYSNVSYK